MWNAGLDDSQAGIKTGGRYINTLIYADDTTLMAEREEELNSLLTRVKESEKAGLKLNIQKTKILASSHITTWHTDRGKKGNSDRYCFLGLQNHCGQWLQPQN